MDSLHPSPDRSRFGHINKYIAGARIVVREGKGKSWILQELVAPAKEEVAGLRLFLKGGREIVVEKEPKILSSLDINPLTDKKGRKFKIDGVRVDKITGKLEYDITTDKGELHKGIPEGFVDAWSKVVEKEIQLDNLEKDVEKLGARTQTELRDKIASLRTLILKLFKNLPQDLGVMKNQTDRTVALAVKKIEKLHTDAEQEIATLKEAVDAGKAVSPSKPKIKAVHVETGAEQDIRKKQEAQDAEARAGRVKIFEARLADKIKIDQEKEIARRHKEKYDAWQAEIGKLTVRTEPTALKPGKVLTKQERQDAIDDFKLEQTYQDFVAAEKKHRSGEMLTETIEARIEQELGDYIKLEQQKLDAKFLVDAKNWEKNNAIAQALEPKEEKIDRLSSDDEEDAIRAESSDFQNDVDRFKEVREFREYLNQEVDPRVQNKIQSLRKTRGGAKLKPDEEDQIRLDVEVEVVAEAMEKFPYIQGEVETKRQARAKREKDASKVEIIAGVKDYRADLQDEINHEIFQTSLANWIQQQKKFDDRLKIVLTKKLADIKKESRDKYVKEKHDWDEAKAKKGPKPTKPETFILDKKEKDKLSEELKIKIVEEILKKDSGLKDEVAKRRQKIAELAPKTKTKVVAGVFDFLDDDEKNKINVKIFYEIIGESTVVYNKLKKESDDELQEAIKDAEIKKQADFVKDLAEWNKYEKLLTEEPKLADIALKKEDEPALAEQSKIDFVKLVMASNHDIEAEINTRRLDRATKDPNPDHKATGSTTEYEDKYKDKVNVELFDALMKEWQQPYQFKEQKVVGAEVFNFKTEVDAVETGFTTLLSEASIPQTKDAAGKVAVEAPYQAIYKKIQDRQTAMHEVAENLSTVEKAKAAVPFFGAGLSSPTKEQLQETLNEAREQFIKGYKDEIDQFQLEIEKMKKPLPTTAPEEFEQLDAMRTIDLSSELVKEILFSDINKAKAAMKALYLGDAKSEFKNLLADHPPLGMDPEVLRDAGIKDWAEFKKLWDSTLAEKVSNRFAEIAKVSLERKLNEALDSLSGMMAKVKATAGQLSARAALTGLLVALPSMALSAALGQSREALTNVAALSTGAVTGTAKWFGGKRLFGENSWWGKRSKRKLEEVEDNTQAKLLDTLVDEFFVTSSPSATPPKTGRLRRFFGLQKPTAEQKQLTEGVDMMSGVTAHLLRSETAGELVVDIGGGRTVALRGADRIRFETAIAGANLDIENVENKQKIIDLAMTFVSISARGDELEEAAIARNPGVSGTDKFIQHYSGRGSWIGSVGVSAVLSRAFMYSSTIRTGFGIALGAYAGAKLGERAYKKAEQREAKRLLVDSMDVFAYSTKEYDRLDDGKRADFKDLLIYFKKFLHGTVPQEDLAAAVFMSKDGPQIDEMLLAQIEGMVYEAEKTGVLIDNEEDKEDMEKVLAIMQEHQGNISEKEEKTLWTRFGKFIKKGTFKLVGAALGGAASGGAFLAAGHFIRPAIKGLGHKLGIGHHTGPGAVAGAHKVVLEEGGSSSMSDEDYARWHSQDTIGASGHLPEVHHLTPTEATQNFAHEHGLSEDGGEALKDLTSKYGLTNDQGSLQRILDASKIPHGKEFLIFSGERSRLVFEEIRDHAGHDQAAKFLRDQKFGASAEAHLGKYFNKSAADPYQDFVDRYDAKKMSGALADSLQADDNILIDKKFGQSGLRIDAKGNVSFFGFKEDGTPILSGDGKLVVKGMHVADVKTWVSDNESHLSKHNVHDINAVRQPALDKQGNYISDNFLDKQGRIVHDTSSPVPDIAWGGNTAEVNSKQVVVADTLATYEPSKNLMQKVDGQAVVANAGEAKTTDAVAGADRAAIKSAVGKEVGKPVSGEAVNDNVIPDAQQMNDIKFRHFISKLADMRNNLKHPGNSTVAIGDAKSVIDQRAAEFTKESAKIIGDLSNKIKGGKLVNMDLPDNAKIKKLFQAVENYDPNNKDSIPGNKDLSLYTSVRDIDTVSRHPIAANGGEFLRIWVWDGSGGGKDLFFHKFGSTFNLDGNDKLIITDSAGTTKPLDYTDALKELQKEKAFNEFITAETSRSQAM